jgi:acetyl-CoA carboxylase biotin carboxyl carrier protein
MPLSDEDVREILRLIDESPLKELSIETEGFVLYVRKGSLDDTASRPPEGPRGGQEAVSPSHTSKPGPPSEQATTLDGPVDDGLVTVEAPMLGTFYRAEGPGQDPFVEVGARVGPDSVVCIIEVMKMMNSVPARVSGTVVEVCQENAQLVEFGQPLFRLRPE